MISKTLALRDWAWKLYNTNMAAITLRLKGINILVINIYNPLGDRQVLVI